MPWLATTNHTLCSEVAIKVQMLIGLFFKVYQDLWLKETSEPSNAFDVRTGKHCAWPFDPVSIRRGCR